MTLPALKCNDDRRQRGAARAGSRCAFTLIELLLVLVLIGILSAVTVPNFVRSIRGNRLRTAVRSVVMAGRYARSMAVLKQRDLVLSFNLDEGAFLVEEIVIVPAADRGGEPQTTLRGVAVEDGNADDRVQSRATLLSRTLDGVAIRAVVVDGERYADGTASIIYSSNGRCTPYVVEVLDAEGRGSAIEVDALSAARTEEL